MSGDDRGISTVLDVAVALVLISAGVTMLFMYVAEDDSRPEPIDGDRTAETFAGTTASVDYSLEPVEDDEYGDRFDYIEGDSRFNRTAQGPITGLLAEAAVANVKFWGRNYTSAGEDFEMSIDGVVLSEVSRMDHEARLDAIWRPYRGSGIEGTASAGQFVPPDAQVSSVTMTVASGFENVTGEVVDNYDDDGDFGEVAAILAQTIVTELFPPEDTQRSLEGSGVERDFAVYRYNQLAGILKDVNETTGSAWGADEMYDPEWNQAPLPGNATLEKESVNARWLNQYLVNQTLANRIELALDNQFDSSTTSAELAQAVSIHEVDITVRTWETDD